MDGFLVENKNSETKSLFRKTNKLMSKFIPGTTAFIKTSNEEVFILGLSGNHKAGIPVNTIDDKLFSGTTAIVRRPVITDDGVKHILDYFLVEELETVEDKVRRQKEMDERVRKTLDELNGEAKLASEALLN